jgi:hypothetical protein
LLILFNMEASWHSQVQPDRVVRYYQICAFPDSDGRYGVRVYIFNNMSLKANRILDRRERYVSCKTVDKLMATLPTNYYKSWAVASLKYIPSPSQDDLIASGSELLM